MSHKGKLTRFFHRTKAPVGMASLEVAADEMSISTPTDVVRTVHVVINPKTGKLTGIPEGWKKYVGSSIR